MIGEGDKVPTLKVETTDGDTIDLSAPGGRLVLFFYPKDMTSGCTKEAIAFSTLRADFEKAGARVVGISRDPAARHVKFIDKESLTVPLVSDEYGAVSDAFGNWQLKKFMGREYMGMVRSTFLVGADGTVLKSWPKVRVKGHAEAVLETVKAL